LPDDDTFRRRQSLADATPPSNRKGAPLAKNQQVEVEMERRSKSDRREREERRKQNTPVMAERRQGERRAKVPRRRQIDPTTCERDYNDEEIVFMQALDAYKRASGRMFPTCSEILEVIRSLGYVKLSDSTAASAPEANSVATTETV
jgi:hypothetical protein